MKTGLFVSGGLGLTVMKELMGSFVPAFVATDKGSVGIQDYTKQHHIPLFIGNPRNGKLISFLADDHYELALSVNYLFILDSTILQRFKTAINFHGSLLPKYRGRTPHVWAIINNEKETGVTAHLIREGCDTGPVVKQIRIPILPDQTGADILKQFEAVYPKMVFGVFQQAVHGTLVPAEQDESRATYFGKRTPEDGKINWDWNRERIRNWVRAQANPYPGAFAFYEQHKCTIDKVVYSDHGFKDTVPNGTIVGFTPAQQPIVKVCDGCLVLDQIRDLSIQFKTGLLFT